MHTISFFVLGWESQTIVGSETFESESVGEFTYDEFNFNKIMKYQLTILLLFIYVIAFSQSININNSIELQASVNLKGGIDLDEENQNYFAFRSGSFDFKNNLWLDISGNNNHAELKNASARIGYNGDLDYTITGILTTDSISVYNGSNLAIIPNNGLLRILEDSIIYGLTVWRSDTIWANIPFCEPKINENMPVISYDVSGNGNHATCAALGDTNITTQDNYFYLIKNGYNDHGSDLLQIDFSTWTGTFPNERPSGITVSSTTSDTNYVSNYNNKCLFRYKASGSIELKLRDIGVLIVGKKYRTIINIVEFDSVVSYLQGLGLAQAGWWTPYHIRSTLGKWEEEFIASSTSWEVNRMFAGQPVSIIFTEPVCYEVKIVPGLINQSGYDALGNVLEYSQTGNKWLRYACDLNFPDDLQTSTYNYGLGGLIKQGYLDDSSSYKIIKTETNHFGEGILVGDTINGDETTICTYGTNEVRKLHSKGIFNNEVNYDSIYQYLRGLYYCNKRNISVANCTYNTNGTGFGNWYKRDSGYIDTLYILNKNNYNHEQLISDLNINQTTEQISPIIFIWDAVNSSQLDSINNMIDNVGAKYTYAINYGFLMTNSEAIELANNGHELAHHTALYEVGGYLSTYKGFYETLANYTENELQTHYANVNNFYDTLYGYNVKNNIYPGGQFDTTTLDNVLDYYETGTTVHNSYMYVPILKNDQYVLNRSPVQIARNFNALSLIGRGAIHDSTLWHLEDIWNNRGFKVFYAHPDYEFDNIYGTLIGWEYYEKLLEKISLLQKYGYDLRIYTMKDAIDLINNELE